MRISPPPRVAATLLLGLAAAGCGGDAATLPATAVVPPDVLSSEPAEGFDAAGEPVLQRCVDGSLRVKFAAFPPSHAPGEAGVLAYQDMDAAMTDAVGRPVQWVPPDVLVIDRPAPDTADRVKAFLAAYRPAG